MKKNFLYQRRIELGLSQSDIANSLNYSIQTISLWESDKGFPSLTIWSKYASILKIDLDGFLNGKIKKDNDNSDVISFNEERFANNLKQLRKIHDLTQASLANTLGINVGLIIKFEKGTSFPSLKQFSDLCNLYGLSYDELYFATSFQKVETKKKKLVFVPIIISSSVLTFVTASVLGFGIIPNLIKKNTTQNIVHEENVVPNETNIDGDNTAPNDDTNAETGNNGNTSTQMSEDVIEYGVYPQKHVSDPNLIEILNNTSANLYGYYDYQGEMYQNVQSTRGGYYFDDHTKIIEDEWYWFKVEPIKWNIVSEDETSYILIANSLLDITVYSSNSLNNYKDSSLRWFLNNHFYVKAFFLEEEKRPTEYEVDNSANTTENSANYFSCENTSDSVWAPSFKDLKLNDLSDEADKERITYASEYVRIQNHSDILFDNSARYWTRSPDYKNDKNVITINPQGNFDYEDSNLDFAIRPMIKLPKL